MSSRPWPVRARMHLDRLDPYHQAVPFLYLGAMTGAGIAYVLAPGAIWFGGGVGFVASYLAAACIYAYGR